MEVPPTQVARRITRAVNEGLFWDASVLWLFPGVKRISAAWPHGLHFRCVATENLDIESSFFSAPGTLQLSLDFVVTSHCMRLAEPSGELGSRRWRRS